MINLRTYVSNYWEWAGFVKINEFPPPPTLKKDCCILVKSTGGGFRSEDIFNFKKEDGNTCKNFFNSFDLLSGHQTKCYWVSSHTDFQSCPCITQNYFLFPMTLVLLSLSPWLGWSSSTLCILKLQKGFLTFNKSICQASVDNFLEA